MMVFLWFELSIFILCSFFCVCMNQAEGVYNQRLQNLALTLDKVVICFFLEYISHSWENKHLYC